MTTDNGVFVVFEEPEARRQHALLLGGLGLTFLEREAGPEPLPRELRAKPGTTYLILPVGLNFLITVSQIRNSFPDAAVVAVGAFSEMERRVHAYLAGVDNCLSTQSGPEELAAILLAIHRKGMRRVSASMHIDTDRADALENEVWTLAEDGWRLSSADGPQLALRKSERLLLLAFARSHGMAVYRGEKIEGTDGERLTGRAIDVVVNRLKQRAELRGIVVPIKSVRGRGYAFVGTLQVEAERFETTTWQSGVKKGRVR